MHIRDLQMRALKVDDIVAENEKIFKVLFEIKKISWENSIGSDVIVFANAEVLHLILRNLLFNAVKHTEAGDSIAVSAAEEGDFWEILVRDTGVGMSAEQLANIWKKTMSGTVVIGKSTGLGLFICKEYIEKMHGTIHIESEESKGTLVRIKLPKNKIPDNES